MEGAKKATKRARKQSALESYNFVDCYAKMVAYISSLQVNDNTRSWIADRVVDMQMKASKAEKMLGEIMVSRNISFLHKAPFVFNGYAKPKIKFVDFYISTIRSVVEVEEGGLGDMASMSDYSERINMFKGKGIKVYHISKEDALDTDKVIKFLASIGL